MAECSLKNTGYNPGGIASLCEFTNEHKEAIQYDLMTSAGLELDEVGGSLSMGAFSSFIKGLATDYESELWRSTHEDMAIWSTTLKTNALLADIYDLLAQLNANMVGGFGRKKAAKVKPMQRPWLKDKTKRIGGKGALPKDKLREWINKHRRK